ncbi:tape measure protein [Rhizobium sp. CG5]|uniref:tape measure protein n=1 Tax=Rhizobium sp. CG5 TaxID=2726076 RepID=UPI002034756B|nr:tape measure protein [Rhizobium sp. CG5]MCM2472156.1 tape measure protein [Rhizobium sp. CG5]
MAVSEERLVAILEARIRDYEKNLAKALKTTNQQFNKIETRGKQLEARMAQIGGNTAARFAAGLGGAISLRAAQQLIDAATRIQNSLKVAGLEGEELSKVYDALFASAQRNAAPIEDLVTLYSRASQSAADLGASQTELLKFTDNVALSLRVGGKSAQEASGALLQLSQVLGGGVVQAEEYNSLIDGAQPLLQAVAAGLKEAGGSVSALTRLVKDGKVSSQAFFRAFEAGAGILETKVAGSEDAISQRFVRLQNVLIDAAGKIDDATGASGRLGSAIEDLAGIISGFGDGIAAVAESDVGAFIGKIYEAYEAARDFKNFMGGWVGTLAEMGKLTNDAFKGLPLGTTTSSTYIQSRIDQAFAGDPAAPKTGRLPASTASSVTPVSITDYKVPSKSGSGKGKADKLDSYEREIQQIEERTAALQAETAAQAGINPLIEDYGYAVEKAKASSDLLNAAKRAGIAITPELEASIGALAEGYAQASVEAQKLAKSQDQARESAEELRSTAKDVFGSFIDDLKNGTSLADSLTNALSRVGDKLIEIGLNSLFSGTGTGATGGLFGGAIIPGILHSGGTAGKDGYGHGRSVSPSTFAGARRYHSGGVAGLKSGEVPAILQRGEVVLPRNTKTSGGGSSSTTIEMKIDVTGARGNSEIEDMVSSGVSKGLAGYDKILPDRVAQISRNPNKR